MKFSRILLIASLIIYNTLNAQITDVVTGVDNPTALIVIGDELYIGETYKISKISLTSNNPTPITVINGVLTPTDFLLHGNDLYIAEGDGTRISKFNITEASPSLTTVVQVNNFPTGLALNGNDLYISELFGNRISKIDITDSSPQLTEVVTGVSGPRGILLEGNDLYIAEDSSNKISKIDITATAPVVTTVVSGIDIQRGFALSGDDLYYIGPGGNPSSISKVNILTSNITQGIVGGFNFAEDLYIYGNEIYVAASYGDKISKFDFVNLSIDEFPNENNIKLYPNPSEEFIQLSEIKEPKNYVIYDILGKKVLEGLIKKDEKIDIRKLTKGLYFLELEQHNILKFLKK